MRPLEIRPRSSASPPTSAVRLLALFLPLVAGACAEAEPDKDGAAEGAGGGANSPRPWGKHNGNLE
jgi:hypothetical protein